MLQCHEKLYKHFHKNNKGIKTYNENIIYLSDYSRQNKMNDKKRNYQKWTNNETNFLIKNYPSKGKEFCLQHLKTTETRMMLKIQNLGLKLNKKTYKKAIQKRYDKPMDNYNVNRDIFKNINLPQVAYVLGFLWADGNIYHKNYHYKISTSIKKIDGIILKNIFFKTGKWSISERKKYTTDTRNNSAQLKISTNNKHLYKLLEKYGYRNKQNAKNITKKIPKTLLHYWWRGYFDGDGCVFYSQKTGYKTSVSISGPYDTNWEFAESLFDNLGIKYSINRRHSKNGSSSNIIAYQREHVNIFGEYLYRGELFGLIRKYKRFQNIKNFKKKNKNYSVSS